MYGSKIGSVAQTSTPPMAFDIAITPSKVMSPAKSIRSPVRFWTVITVQFKPP